MTKIGIFLCRLDFIKIEPLFIKIDYKEKSKAKPQTERCYHAYNWEKDLYPVYIKSWKSNRKINNHILKKCAINMNRHFTK